MTATLRGRIMNRREMLALSASLALCKHLTAEPPMDPRLGELKTLNGYFPFYPPKTLKEWEARRERVREQILVANGLWPMPDLPPVQATIHGTIERKGYTIEKVFFASRPGHYVSGNLYKPEGQGPFPAVLFAHGHWAKGRFMENGDKEIETALKTKAEGTKESAKYHMQAACVSLARHGYVVFQYDMVGVADSTAIGHVAKSGVPHPNGFADLTGELHLISHMGLQTLNTLRSIDFLETLPYVDKTKLGMTGASGGGTQTMIAAAIDERLKAAVPAVMVSTAMQGGCPCENCSLLRVNSGNVEFAACIAPRWLGLTAANDWTKELETKGLPELKALYALYGKSGNLAAHIRTEFPHNYNQPAREFMVAFFNEHLQGKPGAVKEEVFVPVPPKELTVYNDQHPRPKDEVDAKKLAAAIIEADWQELLKRKDPGKIASKALRAMLCDERPEKIAVREGPKASMVDGINVHRAWLGRNDETDSLPALGSFNGKFTGEKVVLWIHPGGKESIFKDDKAVPAAKALFDAGYAIVSGDLLGTGSQALKTPYKVNPVYAGFTFGYNRSLLAQRVHDILTLVGFATGLLKPKTLDIIGWGEAGPWAAIADAACAAEKPVIRRGVFDLQQFDFAKIKDVNDPMMLPGALKYGNLAGLTEMSSTETAYHNAAPGFTNRRKDSDSETWSEEKILKWLLK